LIGRVGRFINPCCELFTNYCADFFIYPRRDRNVFLDEQSVRNYWNVDGGKEIGSEASSFGVFPSECLILLAHEVVHSV
jgi:hypothetical protein